jgi:hypothetical protein
MPIKRLTLCIAGTVLLIQGTHGQEPDDIFELEAFVVYEGLIDVVDGFTGEPYHESNAVVDGFREEFNNILLAYHRRLVVDEYRYLKSRIESSEAFAKDLDALAQRFGVNGFELPDDYLTRDRSMLARLLRDPFFKIESLVVWDLERLERMQPVRPSSKYGRDIRFNREAEKWERRITTQWEVSFQRRRQDGGISNIRVLRDQGLNLETNKGFHFCPPGLPPQVPPQAFKDVILTYPVFIHSREPAAQQVERLKNAFVINLSHIYDPFSWTVRRNVRNRGGFSGQLLERVEAAKLPVSDRDWFNPVLAQLLSDVITISHYGVEEIYDYAMLGKIPVNKNRLGEGLDLLNWNPGESRSVPYDPEQVYPVRVGFDSPREARFIVLDAYRRYGDAFLDRILEKLSSAEEPVSGREIVREALSESSGAPADAYIRAATKVQLAELERFRHEL